MKRKKYCPKCDSFKYYDNNDDCNVCGTKLKKDDSNET